MVSGEWRVVSGEWFLREEETMGKDDISSIEDEYLEIFRKATQRNYSPRGREEHLAQELRDCNLLRFYLHEPADGGPSRQYAFITYAGRLEWARLLRERRDRVWWRRGLWTLWRGLKYILCAFAGAGGAKAWEWFAG